MQPCSVNLVRRSGIIVGWERPPGRVEACQKTPREQRAHHTHDAVELHRQAFEKFLMLRYNRMPLPAIVRVLGNSPTLIQEHRALPERPFPYEDALEGYLEDRGVRLNDKG